MSTVVPEPAGIAPIVVDLGKKKKKDIRALKRGEGVLIEDVQRVLDEIRAHSSELSTKELVPIVILYRKAAKRSARVWPFGSDRAG